MVDHMAETIGSYKDKQIFIGILHGDCEDDALALKDMINKKLGYDNFVIVPIGPSIGAHSGPGTLGVVFMGEKR